MANERLEFLGDAVLDLIVVEGLWHRYPSGSEGELSKLKAMLVSGSALHLVAESLHLGEFILMSASEARNGGRRRSSILEDTMEALIAALYLDGGIKAASCFVEKYILSRAAGIASEKIDINYKSRLLEFAQGQGLSAPHYWTIEERGPDHMKEFVIDVLIGNNNLGRGTGRSKKSAQQDAARKALIRIEQSPLLLPYTSSHLNTEQINQAAQ
jgi:ribonuclease-3